MGSQLLFEKICEVIWKYYHERGEKTIPLMDAMETLESVRTVFMLRMTEDFMTHRLKADAEKYLRKMLK